MKIKHSALTTGIGSLPFARRHIAEDHVLRHYSLPFYPQLPRTTERAGGAADIPSMVLEALTAPMVKAVTRADAEAFLNELAAATAGTAAAMTQVAMLPGLGALLSRLKGRRTNAPWTVKLQVIGPTMLSVWLLSQLATLRSSELQTLTRAWCAKLTGALVTLATSQGAAPLVIIDDPLLAQAATPIEGAWFHALATATAAQGGKLGLHDCAPASVAALVREFAGAILAIDLNVVSTAGLWENGNERHLTAHAEAGGGFIFGVVDTRRDDINMGDINAALATARRIYGFGFQHLPFLLSGGCGTGLHTESYEVALAKALREGCAI